MLGSKIKKYRELRNLTQEELADMLFISPKTLGHYETGARDCRKLDVLAALTKTLGFSVLIKKGKVYIEEETKMENNKTNNNLNNINDMEDITMNNKELKTTIMEKHKGDYYRTIAEFCYGRYTSLSEEEFKVVTDLFNDIKTTDVCKIALNNSLLSIESGVYESDKYYLLDLRAFEEMKDEMIDAFMIVFNKDDFSVYDGEVDDVWDFADWTEIL